MECGALHQVQYAKIVFWFSDFNKDFVYVYIHDFFCSCKFAVAYDFDAFQKITVDDDLSSAQKPQHFSLHMISFALANDFDAFPKYNC